MYAQKEVFIKLAAKPLDPELVKFKKTASSLPDGGDHAGGSKPVKRRARPLSGISTEEKSEAVTVTPTDPKPLQPAPSIRTAQFDVAAMAELLAPMVAREVVKLLAAQFSLTPLSVGVQPRYQPHVPHHNPQPTDVSDIVRVKLPVVLVYGLLNDQAAAVSKVWGHRFELRFRGAARGDKLMNDQLNGCAYAVSATSFMSHPVDARLQKHFKKNYIRTTGGVSSINKALNYLWARTNFPVVTSHSKQ